MATKKTAQKTEEKAQITRRRETRNLKTVLTAEELASAAEELAQSTQAADRLEEEKKSMVSEFKARIEEAVARRNKFANIVSTKSEYRQVDCEIVLDYDTKRVTVTRLDSGEVVTERAMFEEELQRKLPMSE